METVSSVEQPERSNPEGPLITQYLEAPAAYEWRDWASIAPVEPSAEESCPMRVSRSFTLVAATCVLIASLVAGATLVGVELLEAASVSTSHSPWR